VYTSEVTIFDSIHTFYDVILKHILIVKNVKYYVDDYVQGK